MIHYREALDIVVHSKADLQEIQLSLQECLGYVLSRDVVSDINMPPFNKSAVDGYACRMEDIYEPLRCLEIIRAGSVPGHRVGKGECVQLMTGCMVPEGADCVLMVEHTEKLKDGRIRFLHHNTSSNICLEAEDVQKGTTVLHAGTLLQPEHIAVLAMTGCVKPHVFEKPGVGIISTGDEIVPPEQLPGPAKIRDSNSAQLFAQLQKAGFRGINYGIIPDSPEKTSEAIRKSLSENAVTLITGGVSLGEYDFVPEMMKQAGLNILFKSIAVQPGRPTLFGTSASGRFCFGLPGNPVSSFVQFHLLVIPLLYKLSGHRFNPLNLRLPLVESFSRKKTGRMGVIPVKINAEGGVEQLSYHGSAHIHAYVFANAFMLIAPDVRSLQKGEQVNVRLI